MRIPPIQLHPNTWAFVYSFEALCNTFGICPTIPLFFYFFRSTRGRGNKDGLISLLGVRERKILDAYESSYKSFKDGFFKVRTGPEVRSYFNRPDGTPLFPLVWNRDWSRTPVVHLDQLSSSEKEAVQFLEGLPCFGCSSIMRLRSTPDRLKEHLRESSSHFVWFSYLVEKVVYVVHLVHPFLFVAESERAMATRFSADELRKKKKGVSRPRPSTSAVAEAATGDRRLSKRVRSDDREVQRSAHQQSDIAVIPSPRRDGAPEGSPAMVSAGPEHQSLPASEQPPLSDPLLLSAANWLQEYEGEAGTAIRSLWDRRFQTHGFIDNELICREDKEKFKKVGCLAMLRRAELEALRSAALIRASEKEVRAMADKITSADARQQEALDIAKAEHLSEMEVLKKQLAELNQRCEEAEARTKSLEEENNRLTVASSASQERAESAEKKLAAKVQSHNSEVRFLKEEIERAEGVQRELEDDLLKQFEAGYSRACEHVAFLYPSSDLSSLGPWHRVVGDQLVPPSPEDDGVAEAGDETGGADEET